jgi:hypothetical protein
MIMSTYDPHNVSHPSGIPLAYQAATHDPEYGHDFEPAEASRAEDLSRAQEARMDEISQAIAEAYQDWTPCQMYGHNFGPDGCLDCGEDY